MKRILLSVFIVATLFGCNNDLQINAPWEDVTVVYGLLDQGQDTNWVRIHRGYLGNEGVAGGSQNPDSLYYKNLIVEVQEIAPNGAILNTWALIKDNSTHALNDGFFTTEGYHLYRLDQKVSPTNSYKLNIYKPGVEGETTSSTSLIVGNFNITKPLGQQKISFGPKGQDFIWDAAKQARIYQGYLRFYYVEINAFNAGDSVHKYVDYNLPTKIGSTIDGNGSITNTISYEQYYRFLYNAIGEKENVKRFFRGMDIYVVAGADDLATYISVSQPAQGIVQDKPLYTNVTNGVGIFSSIGNAEKLAMSLSSPSLDSLIKGIYTCELMFGKASQADTCFCLVPGQFICN